MASLNEIVNHPKFNTLTLERQKELLTKTDERFGTLGVKKQEQYISLVTQKPVRKYEGNDPRMNEINKISNTFDVSKQRASLTDEKELEERGLLDKAGSQFVAGVGDLMSLVGGFGKRSNFLTDESPLMDWMVDEGTRLQQSYGVKQNPDKFKWSDLLDPEWYATNIPRSLPTSLSLIPLSFFGRSLGLGIATKMATNTFGRYLAGSLGAAAVSRPAESALESQGAYDQAIAEGKSEEEADKIADDVFKNNLALAGLDAGEFLSAFSPIKFRSANKALRMAAMGFKTLGVAGMEGVEERIQEFIQAKAENPNLPYSSIFDDRFDEATAVGAIFGLGLGGVGSVYNLLTQEVENHIEDQETKDQYENDKNELGKDEALNRLAEKDQGKKAIDNTVKTLKEKSQPKREEEQISKPVETQEDITENDINEFLERTIKGGAPEPIEPIQFTQSEKQKNAGEIVVIADVGKMDDLWKKSSLYIKEGAPLQSNNIEMPSVDITDQGTVEFIDGRNRFSALRDAGIKQVEISMSPEMANKAKQLGLLKEKKPKRKVEKMISESQALKQALKKSAIAARKAYREGNKDATVREQTKIKNILHRQKKIRSIRDELGLTDNDMKKATGKKNPLVMSEPEYKQFLQDVYKKSVEVADTKQAKAELMNLIRERNLQKTENFRRAMKLPTISKMNADQLRVFAEMLEPYQEGDVFLSQRQLEVVDKTDIRGIKTWREAKEKLAKEAGVSYEEMETLVITRSQRDAFRWDSTLMQKNPVYKLLVQETHKEMFNADLQFFKFEKELNRLSRAATKSRKQGILNKVIPQQEMIFNYLESDNKGEYAKGMTKEELDYAHFIEQYYEDALDYLTRIGALKKGRREYITHIRRPFLETVKDEGLLKAFKEMMTKYDQDLQIFGILEGDTANILPKEKFFKHTLHRSGGLVPSKNVTKAVLSYARQFERKRALDRLIPKMDIYAQAVTPEHYTPLGLEMDRSFKQFVYEYINNKKGRQSTWRHLPQGGVVDHALRGLKAITSIIDLGLNIPVGVASFVGEQTANFFQLGGRKTALGIKRKHTQKGKDILEKYKAFTGKSTWEEFAEPEKVITERLSVGLFGMFHQSYVEANRTFLLGSITEEELSNGEISADRLSEIRLEMGRMRVIPGTKSLFGSTAIGSVMTQYRTWAVPIVTETIRDIKTFTSNLKNKPIGEAITTREARELMRIVGTITPILVAGSILLSEEEEEGDVVTEMIKRIYRESLSVIGALNPRLWAATPRVLDFVQDIGESLEQLIKLEEYKTKRGLKGVEGLKRQLTPRTIKQILPEEE